jgi:hypothetical protein
MIPIFTITAKNYLNLALALGKAVVRHHPDAHFNIGVADGLACISLNYENFGYMMPDARTTLPGSVFDGVALNVHAIVSDVSINLETDEPRVQFFKASNVDALAQAMTERLVARLFANPSQQAFVKAGLRRRRACGEELLAEVDSLRSSH